MASSKAIQGKDTQIRLFRNGTLVNVVEVSNFNVKQDADFTRSSYLGNVPSIGDVNHKGWSGDFEVEVVNAAIDDLIDALITENLSRIDYEEIVIHDQENYRDGTKAAWVYYGIQMRYSKTASGRDEKVKKKIEFQADERRKIF